MEKVIVDCRGFNPNKREKDGSLGNRGVVVKRVPTTAAERAQRAKDAAEFTPPVRKRPLEEVLIEKGLISEADLLLDPVVRRV